LTGTSQKGVETKGIKIIFLKLVTIWSILILIFISGIGVMVAHSPTR